MSEKAGGRRGLLGNKVQCTERYYEMATFYEFILSNEYFPFHIHLAHVSCSDATNETLASNFAISWPLV